MTIIMNQNTAKGSLYEMIDFFEIFSKLEFNKRNMENEQALIEQYKSTFVNVLAKIVRERMTSSNARIHTISIRQNTMSMTITFI